MELLKNAHDHNSELVENLSTIDSTIQFVVGQIKQRLDYALIDSGKFNLNLQRLRLAQDVLLPAISTFRGQICMQNAHLKLSVPEEEPFVMVDKLRTQQIVVNLVSNALKFTPENGQVKCEAVINSRDASKVSYSVSVKDEGPGV